MRDKEKQSGQVFNDLVCAKAQLKVLKANKSDPEEVKAQEKVIELENKLEIKKKENDELRGKIGNRLRNLDGPLQFNRIGSGRKYRNELDNV